MATYYWYGGTGNWSDYTNHWSTNSGNSPSSPAPNAPTSADNVIFDNNSVATSTTFSVTVDVTSNCATFDVSALTLTAKKMTLTGSAALNVYGSWNNPGSTLYASTYTGALTFAATTTGFTIQTNSVVIISATGTLTFNGAGGWTLSGALSTGANLSFSSGTLATANFNITFAGNFTSSAPASFTFTPGTGTLTCSNTAFATFSANGQTFYNVTFSGATQNGTVTISGTNTFNNLTFAYPSTNGIRQIILSNNQTVSGTLSFGTIPNTGVRRVFVRSDVAATQRTITMSGASSSVGTLTDLDFKDIVFATASGSPVSLPLSGTRLGNCLNNSQITFGAGVNKYWYTAAGTGGLWTDTAWVTTAGGTSPASTNFPLAQDTAIFQASSGLNSGATVSISTAMNIGTLDASARTSNTMVLGFTTPSPQFYGNLVLGTGVSLTGGTGLVAFAGQGLTQQITSAGATFASPISVASPAGTVTLQDNCSTSSSLYLLQGTLNLNTKTLTIGAYTAFASTSARAITFNSGTIVVTASITTSWNENGSNLTTSAGSGNGTISMTGSASKTFVGGGVVYAATLNQGGAGTLTVTGSNGFAGLSNTVNNNTITFTAGTTTTFTQAVTLAGASSNLITLGSSTTSPFTFTFPVSTTTSSLNYCSISYCVAQENAYWRAYQSNGCVDAGNNLGWIFVPMVYTGSGSQFTT